MGAVGNWPESAWGTRLILAPHTRQKLAPSTFCAAHFGQNTMLSCDESQTESIRRVGASAPRCFVVPSVTLGGDGINSPVFRGGGDATVVRAPGGSGGGFVAD